MTLIQPGQQEVIIGSLPSPLVNLLTNSVASSTMVRSAPKLVSYTFSKPMILAAVGIFPVTEVPML